MKKLVFFMLYAFASIFAITYSMNHDFSTVRKQVMTGADVLISEKIGLIKGKTVGIITNKTGVLSNGMFLVDTLYKIKNVKVKALFSPEHGIRGNAANGIKVSNSIDAKTGLPIYSLYGKTKKPTAEMLKGIDILIFDIQGVGARFYTYISTLYYVLKAAAENNIEVIVLDRPNPIGGEKIDGPIREKKFKSFVAIAPIPIRYAMTMGELAEMFNESGMLGKGLKANLIVIKMKNWKRDEYYDKTGLKWIKPSPNIPNLETALVYPGICFLEGTNISEGRGTLSPFLTIGAPFIKSGKLITELNKLGHNGLKISPVKFIPHNIPGMSVNPKYNRQVSFGIKLNVINRNKFRPVRFGVKLLYAVKKLYPKHFKFRGNWLDKLFGASYLRIMLSDNKTPSQIINRWQKETDKFKKMSKQYYLYK